MPPANERYKQISRLASHEAGWRTQARADASPLDLVIVLKQPARDQGLLNPAESA
jgi:hypothetical protein